MTTRICAFCIVMVIVLCHSMVKVKGQPPVCPDTIFVGHTMNKTAVIGEQVEFICELPSGLDSRIFANWKRSNFPSFDFPETIANSVDENIVVMGNRLILESVSRSNVGFYRCSVTCLTGIRTRSSNVASLSITDIPVISSDTTVYSVDTLANFSVTYRITGSPNTIRVFHVVNGAPQEISSDTDSRFSVELNFFELYIRLEIVKTSDGGEYRIEATNGNGTGDFTFTLNANGPDPPELNVVPFIVVNLEDTVKTLCSINQGANIGRPIVWQDNKGEIVTTVFNNPVYSEELANGSAFLHILSLTTSLTGTYNCRANNSRGNDLESIDILGPPPPPGRNPTIMVMDSSVSVSWMRPTTRGSSAEYISSYLIRIYNDDSDSLVGEPIQVSDTANSTEVSYTVTDLGAGRYTITITSSVNSINGVETERSSFIISPSSAFPIVVVGAAVAGAVVFIIIVAVVGLVFGIYCFCSYKARKNQINSQHRTWSSEEEKNTQLPPSIQNTYTALSLHGNTELPPSPLSPMTSSIGIDPKWEFPRENIQLLDPLAEGQFTILYKGMATDLIEKPCTVAVKTLRENATEDDLKAFVYEMDVLSSIDEHPNIVSLVRVCSVGRPLYMVMEYMCHGDLLGFLRACRGHHNMYTVSPGTKYHPPALQLCSRDLLNMATKIANGMHYLADRKIVHRALCTKNILVGSGMDVKIYNVGSFDAVLDNNREGLVKWMAPETLFDGTNTTYSDVWSFGVTLWELVTLGGTPYGKMQPEDLYAQLQSGMRMPCPTHCAQEVYEIMSVCWEKNPTDRPHFSIIHDSLDDLVMSKLNYLDLKSYDGCEYSEFVDDPLRPQATVL